MKLALHMQNEIAIFYYYLLFTALFFLLLLFFIMIIICNVHSEVPEMY